MNLHLTLVRHLYILVPIMNNLIDTPRHPIRVVAQRTGLTAATIRAWERRYRTVSPGRSAGGQRLYSDQDVKRLTTLKALTDGGRTISVVSTLTDSLAEALLLEDQAMVRHTPTLSEDTDPALWVERAYAQVLSLDSQGLEHTLWQAAITIGSHTLLDAVIAVLLERIGTGWIADEIAPAQEHLATGVIVRVLHRLTDHRNNNGPTLVVATLPGEVHGLGAQLTSAAAILEGWRVAHLGTDLPIEEIANASETLGAHSVAISVTRGYNIKETANQLISLRRLIDGRIQLLVGGGSAHLLDFQEPPKGMTIVLSGLQGLRENLINSKTK
jgi:DNA-binding transcriptional MerR regulator/methylmalonyl-CoA mutase cobalamin-binding subunit